MEWWSDGMMGKKIKASGPNIPVADYSSGCYRREF